VREVRRPDGQDRELLHLPRLRDEHRLLVGGRGALDLLQAKWGADIPYAALAEGLNFRGQKVPFLNKAYGIYRSRVQSGPAALSVNSSPK
jgi:hypothetical protein